MRHSDNRFLMIFALVTFACLNPIASRSSLNAEESSAWTRFRGPNGSGVAVDSKVPVPWQASDIQWQLNLPGEGNGSAVVWDNRFFILSADPKSAERYVIAGDMKSGKIAWTKSFPSKTYHLHKLSSYASSTPCVDEKCVYCVWAEPEEITVKAFTHDGDEVWTKKLGRFTSQHGFGTSPIRVDDMLVFTNSQDTKELPPGVEPGEDHLVALDAATGELRWDTKRNPLLACYAVPCVAKDANGKSILYNANTGEGFLAIDAATGKTLWSRSAFTKRVCGSTILAGDLLLASEGSGGGGNILIATEAKANGKEVFRITKAAPYVPTPVVVGDLAFLWADNGIVTCISLSEQGKVLWTERIGGNVSSSPVVVRDRLIGISQDGVVTILAASPIFEKLGEIKLEQTCRSTPAVTENAMLIRTSSQLICVGNP